jgi:hypothetical protein
MPQLNIKPFAPKKQPTKARYEVRFVNGVWTIFDRWNFNHGGPLPTRKQADRVCSDLNTGGLKWAA